MAFTELALVLFSLTLVGGFSIAVYGLRAHRGLPVAGYAHGALGLAALAALFERVAHGPVNLGFNSAVFLFALTVVGGLFLALFKLRREAPPLAFILIHGTVGAVAFLVFALAFTHA